MVLFACSIALMMSMMMMDLDVGTVSIDVYFLF